MGDKGFYAVHRRHYVTVSFCAAVHITSVSQSVSQHAFLQQATHLTGGLYMLAGGLSQQVGRVGQCRGSVVMVVVVVGGGLCVCAFQTVLSLVPPNAGMLEY